jgi:hypothetical protein
MVKKKETIEDLIRGQAPASVIMKKTGLKLPTIQKHVGVLQAMDKKYYDIEGLWEKKGNIRFTKMGVILHKTRFMNSDFELNDEFTMDFDSNKITLTKIQ